MDINVELLQWLINFDKNFSGGAATRARSEILYMQGKFVIENK